MADMAKVGAKDIVFDLGCGDAKPLIAVVKKYNCRAVGIEIDPLRFLYSRLNVAFSGQSSKIKIIRGNLFKQDLSHATVIFVYLIPKALDKLLPMLKELPKGTRIVSKDYEIDMNPFEKDGKNNLFLYVI
jgi:predicted RNA methylase